MSDIISTSEGKLTAGKAAVEAGLYAALMPAALLDPMLPHQLSQTAPAREFAKYIDKGVDTIMQGFTLTGTDSKPSKT